MDGDGPKPQPGAPGWGVVEGLPIRGRQPKVLTSERQIINPYQYKPISRQHRDLCMATEDVSDNANVLRTMSRYFFDIIDDNVRVADAHGFEFSSVEAARSEASRSRGDRAGPTGYKSPCIPGARPITNTRPHPPRPPS